MIVEREPSNEKQKNIKYDVESYCLNARINAISVNNYAMELN